MAEALSALKRSHVIQEWHDRQIQAGQEWKHEIDRHLNTADVILLLVSAAFLRSEYCWSEELKRAMARHEAGEALVIPVILRPCDWEGTPFDKLQMLPKDAKAITSWSNEDEALTNVAKGIRLAVKQVAERKQQQTMASQPVAVKPRESMTQTASMKAPASVSVPQPEDDLQSEKGMDYAPLRDMLKSGKWKKADRETRRVMCAVMGRQQEGWLREEDAQKFPCDELGTIDRLWVKYSDGRFGFSVQKRIYVETGDRLDGKHNSTRFERFDYSTRFERFGDRVGWRVEREWISYSDVNFDISSPYGHLPASPTYHFTASGLGRASRFWSSESFSSLAQRLVSCNTSQS